MPTVVSGIADLGCATKAKPEVTVGVDLTYHGALTNECTRFHLLTLREVMREPIWQTEQLHTVAHPNVADHFNTLPSTARPLVRCTCKTHAEVDIADWMWQLGAVPGWRDRDAAGHLVAPR